MLRYSLVDPKALKNSCSLQKEHWPGRGTERYALHFLQRTLPDTHPGTESRPRQLESRSQHNKGLPQHSPTITPQINTATTAPGNAARFNSSGKLNDLQTKWSKTHSPWRWSALCRKPGQRCTHTDGMNWVGCTCLPSFLASTRGFMQSRHSLLSKCTKSTFSVSVLGNPSAAQWFPLL